MTHKPITLLQRVCPSRVIYEDKARLIKLRPCKDKPLANGFCPVHQYQYNLLCLLKEIGNPALQVNEYLSIAPAAMEEYILRVPDGARVAQIRAAIAEYKKTVKRPVVIDDWMTPQEMYR